ncbi:isoprenoid synthase domain-containing protein [Aspergillus alliaceus]|uniref:Isoprenoid synthase domain-containing protein n=1 Tax=Petromyces alliaceus TaxID=209559 RepID=A0A5N7CHK6_PETAA|nr:isoprenoid synthase domain-containing protein [Aspergillus alliaceus]
MVSWLPENDQLPFNMGSHLDIKPVEYIFDPAPLDTGYTSKGYFTFLEDAKSGKIRGLEESHCFDPRDMGLPWPTTFPATVQSKHWRSAEEAAKEFLGAIRSVSASKEPQSTTSDYRKRLLKRDSLLIDAAASTAVNFFPAANAVRARLLAQAALLVFLHDDDADSEGYGLESNILKEALEELQSLPDDPKNFQGPWKNPVFQDWVDQCVQENFGAGLQIVQGTLLWANHTLDNPPKKRVQFVSWKNYIDYRLNDFLPVGISGMLQFSCGIYVPESERAPLEAMYRLYMMHCSLTNDLYSYEKERMEAKEEDLPIVNGVEVLGDILYISSDTAKRDLRQLILELERQLHHVYIAHTRSGELNDRQLRYARAMIEGLAGSLFFSSTLARYASVIPGSHLPNERSYQNGTTI